MMSLPIPIPPDDQMTESDTLEDESNCYVNAGDYNIFS